VTHVSRLPKGLENRRRARLEAKNAWKAFKSSSLSSFAFVDSMGLSFARNLYRDAFGDRVYRAEHHDHAGLTDDEDKTRLPRVTAMSTARRSRPKSAARYRGVAK
jgi:uncharacterized protein YbcC (UPF0753/DUF2309 family)